jgi:hypothetical protein
MLTVSKVALRLDQLYLKCCIEELVSQASDPVGIHSTVDIPIRQHWYTATARTDSIVSCFSAAMTFIETFCNLTVEGHRRVTILEYTRLFHVIAMLEGIVSSSVMPNGEVIFACETAQLEHRLLELVRKMDELVTSTSEGNEQLDFFWHMRRVFGTIAQQCESHKSTVTRTGDFSEWCDQKLTGILRPEPQQTAEHTESCFLESLSMSAVRMQCLDPKQLDFISCS